MQRQEAPAARREKDTQSIRSPPLYNRTRKYRQWGECLGSQQHVSYSHKWAVLSKHTRRDIPVACAQLVRPCVMYLLHPLPPHISVRQARPYWQQRLQQHQHSTTVIQVPYLAVKQWLHKCCLRPASCTSCMRRALSGPLHGLFCLVQGRLATPSKGNCMTEWYM